ncbi:MAG: hypothetical protein ACYDHU_08425 [Acidimicrobiales bacterium]
MSPPPVEADGPDSLVVAMIAAAADQLWSGPPVPAPPGDADPTHRAWRFSGRWWSRPAPVRRVRPWSG